MKELHTRGDYFRTLIHNADIPAGGIRKRDFVKKRRRSRERKREM